MILTRDLPIGRVFENDQFIAFFGNKGSTWAAVQATFPAISFTRVKQVHGPAIVDSVPGQDFANEADGHFSVFQNHGLGILTGDCSPILLYASDLNLVAAIHSGWRGVAQRIVPKAMQQLLSRGSDPQSWTVLVGPHIQQASFEIESHFALELSATVGRSFDLPSPTPGKNLVDLQQILALQIAEVAGPQVLYWKLDTRTSLDFHSHRRDGHQSGRQLSFIARK